MPLERHLLEIGILHPGGVYEPTVVQTDPLEVNWNQHLPVHTLFSP